MMSNVWWYNIKLLSCCMTFFVFFLFKQKTAYEMRISDWSSDVCSSDLKDEFKMALKWTKENCKEGKDYNEADKQRSRKEKDGDWEIGRASCRERVCQYV